MWDRAQSRKVKDIRLYDSLERKQVLFFMYGLFLLICNEQYDNWYKSTDNRQDAETRCSKTHRSLIDSHDDWLWEKDSFIRG